jgi:hypothetical protein
MLDRRDARVHKHLLEFLKKTGGPPSIGLAGMDTGDWTGIQQRVLLYAAWIPRLFRE